MDSALDSALTADPFVAGVTGLAPDVVHGTGSAADVREIAARQPDLLCAGIVGATGFSAKAATRR
ncbi:hypothetical protein E1218_08025 [Kribbella turkmenica]|uniref:Uncharacterized protein n=1 Tax=Kribbella turkmenica TaxID=2530375 RepID=A0A4R4XCN9_9ACTN|nr:hypothetical protein [Kribbella turkmenica]TDD28202.1 hypothetical protein E1218_08025 [Kribbella turkmenica]